MIQFSWHEWQTEDNSFQEKLGQAMKSGFFYLGIPEELNKNIPFAVQYAENLRNNTALKSMDLGGITLGYKKRPETQIATFNTRKHQWKEIFPNEIFEIVDAMHMIGMEVLKKSLRHLSVPENAWSIATGNLTNNEGESNFSINHYKPKNKTLGLIPHKDIGWVTVLFINKHGLQKRNDSNEWEAIPPKEGHFIVNFGQSFEIFVNSVDKLKASIHRVQQLEEERISLVSFLQHTKGMDIYNVDAEGQLIRKGSYDDFGKICKTDFQNLQKELESERKT